MPRWIRPQVKEDEFLPAVEGFLLKQAIADGAVMKPGDVVYRIDPRQYEASVLAAEGKGFCAGQDLADPAVAFKPGEPPPSLGAVVERDYGPLVVRLTELRMPTVAMVQGIAAGIQNTG